MKRAARYVATYFPGEAYFVVWALVAVTFFVIVANLPAGSLVPQ